MPKLNLTFRDATADDLPALYQLRYADAPGIHKTRLDDTAGGQTRYLVAELDGILVGFTTLVFQRPAHWSAPQHADQLPSVQDLFIREDLRGRGIGSRFMFFLEDQVAQAGFHRLSLSVDPIHNVPARRLYERLGYHPLQSEPYHDHWEFSDANGALHQGDEWLIDLVKELPGSRGLTTRPALLECCRYPELAEPYDTALRQAVEFILGRFDMIGLFACGTIIRGNPSPTSDLDLYVIVRRPQRQRLQRFFNGIACEIFSNPPFQIRKYFSEEQAEGTPITAHMLATGCMLLELDPVVSELRQQAAVLMASPPTIEPRVLFYRRYGLATQLEDGRDVSGSDPLAANLFLNRAVDGMLEYAFLTHGRHIPRTKDMATALQALDPRLAELAQAYTAAVDASQRLAIAEALADVTIQAQGFFEWDGGIEAL
jgi:GNAT superfamily N-acetyltransferase